MSVHDHFDPERNLLVVVFDGAIGDEDLLKYARHAVETWRTPSGHDELIDLRGVEDVDGIGGQTLRRVAGMFTRSDRTPERSRVAIVAASDVQYGLARMYQAFRSESPLDLRVFREMDEARAWLGLGAE
jgi:hypothetical protein